MIAFTHLEIIIASAAALALLGLNAVFVAAEFSLVKLRFTRFNTGKMKEARQSESVSKLLNNMGEAIKLLRLGITASSVGMGFLLAPLSFAAVEGLGLAQGALLRLGILVSILLAVGIHFVIGELTPRAIALQYPVRSLKLSLPFVAIFRVLTKPYAAVLSWASAAMLRLLKLDPSLDLNVLDVEAQIRSLVSEGKELPAVAESIVSNAIKLSKRVAHDIMIPRNQLRYFDLNDTIEENLAIARKTGHTRFPLCKGDLDDCLGIIHVKDLFRSGKASADIELIKVKRPILRFSMDEPLERVLQGFLKQKKHFAMLIDEFGGAVGAVSLEDVLEELVGEIQDEFDKDEEMVREVELGVYEVDGLTPLHDLSEALDIDIEAEEVSTFGGYVTLELGRMPKQGESFRVGPLEVIAATIDDRRMVSALVKPIPESDRESEGEASA